MKETVELDRQRDFGDILNDTFVFIGQNFAPIVKCIATICGVFILANIGACFIANAQRSTMLPNEFVFSAYYWMQLGFSTVQYTALTLTVTSYMAVYKEKGNQPATVAEVWGYFRYYFFRAFGIMLMITIINIVGFILCIVPGVYLMVVFSLAAPVMIMENGSIDYTFKRIFKIIKENWWFTLGVLLLTGILAVIGIVVIHLPTIIIYGPAAWLTGRNFDDARSLLDGVLKSISGLFYTLPVVALVLQYFNITEEQEANNLASRIKMFGRNDGGATGEGTALDQY